MLGELRVTHTMADREQHKIPLKCPKCARAGFAIWEENIGPELNNLGPMTTLESVSAGFYRRVVKAHRGNIEIVCDFCGTIQAS
jgi:hypothetical protein